MGTAAGGHCKTTACAREGYHWPRNNDRVLWLGRRPGVASSRVNVRLGSKADIGVSVAIVRFALQSRRLSTSASAVVVSSVIKKSRILVPGADSNHRHADFQSAALPTELPGPIGQSSEAPSLPPDGGRAASMARPWLIEIASPLSRLGSPCASNHRRLPLPRLRPAHRAPHSGHRASGRDRYRRNASSRTACALPSAACRRSGI